MTIQEKILLFAKEYPSNFISSVCPIISTPCCSCPYSWGGSAELCPLDAGIPYVKDIKLSIIKDQPELFI